MNPPGTMLEQVQRYLEDRRALGVQLRVEGQQLLQFARYADGIGHRGPLTTDLALQWARLPKGGSPVYWARRLQLLRCFARYQAVFDPHTEIPLPGLLGHTHHRAIPYIYSEDEVARLITEAKQLIPIAGLRPRTYATLIGLLACSGLRISEALRLSVQDVDLSRGLLTIRETKFHKSRLVPLHPSTIKMLRDYERCRTQSHPLTSFKAFFLSERGHPLSYSTVRTTFQKLLRQTGIGTSPDSRPPRIYDLRHTFATRRLLKWYEEGVDVDHAILALSTYLGHVKVSDTYWYITGVPDLLAVSASRFERFATYREGDPR